MQPLKFRNGKEFHPTIYNGCNYLSILGLKSIHVSKRGHWRLQWHNLKKWPTLCKGNISTVHHYWYGETANISKPSQLGIHCNQRGVHFTYEGSKQVSSWDFIHIDAHVFFKGICAFTFSCLELQLSLRLIGYQVLQTTLRLILY